MGTAGLANGLFQAFIDWMYSSGDISVPGDFHTRCECVLDMLDDDISGLINTILDYSVASATGTNYRVKCANETLRSLLNLWLEKVNLDVKGIPTGLSELSREYFKERWQGSSFCILKLKNWKEIKVGETSIEVPTVMWFVNGSSIYVKSTSESNYKIGSDEHYFDSNFKNPITKLGEESVISKPYARWFDQYPSPYLIRKGVYKNWLGMKVLQNKSDEVISKILPYLFIIKKGTERMAIEGDTKYEDKELKTFMDGIKEELAKFKNEKGRTPTNAVNFDTEYNHLIPDLRNIMTEELYRQGNRTVLSGLGFVDVIQGISSTRKESVLNPKPFVAEVNDGVVGFKSMLLEVIYKIIERNKKSHPKFFNDNNKIIIANSPLKINVEPILDQIRSAFVYGDCSITTHQEALGLDPDTERENRQYELDNGLEDLYYPHLVQNVEAQPDRVTPAKPKNTKKQEEKQVEKETQPEHMQEGMFIGAPYKNISEVPAFIKKMPQHAQEIFMSTFNSVYEDTKDEGKSMAIAINAAKRWTIKNGYKYNKENKTWEKK